MKQFKLLFIYSLNQMIINKKTHRISEDEFCGCGLNIEYSIVCQVWAAKLVQFKGDFGW